LENYKDVVIYEKRLSVTQLAHAALTSFFWR